MTVQWLNVRVTAQKVCHGISSSLIPLNVGKNLGAISGASTVISKPPTPCP